MPSTMTMEEPKKHWRRLHRTRTPPLVLWTNFKNCSPTRISGTVCSFPMRKRSWQLCGPIRRLFSSDRLGEQLNQYTQLWLEEHVAALAALIAKGLSRRDSAAALNEQFGTTYTRNAVIGVAHRRGLIVLRKPKRKPKPVKQQRYEPKKRQPVFSYAAYVALECSEIVPLNLSLLDLELGQCRFPYGDNDFTFCGHPAQEGLSYCPSHEKHCHKRPYAISQADHQSRRERSIRFYRQKMKQEFLTCDPV